MWPGVRENRDDEQMAVRQAEASGANIRQNQHEEDRMRDIHVGKRGSEAASEEQPDRLRKTVRFEQEAPSASASSDPCVAQGYLVSCEIQNRLGSVLVQKSGHVNDDVQICVECSARWIDERVVASEKCWIGIEEKMPETSREVNLEIDMSHCPRGKNWKSNQKVATDEKVGKLGKK